VLDPKGMGGNGAWCACKPAEGEDPASFTLEYCDSPPFTPEQINLQIADPTTVVLSFVTFEPSTNGAPTTVPTAMVGKSVGRQLYLRGVRPSSTHSAPPHTAA
jgi:hypothetical protein